MCVLAGVIGDRSAAPILLEMLQKQEGLGGGFYTGIATIHEDKLYYRKVVGDVAKLRAETDAASLPGMMGIAHSRTPSGGDVEWGHPFVACDGRMAYVAQGSRGYFDDQRVNVASFGNDLLAKGHAFRAVSDDKVGNYPVLSDGKSVHISDIMCHLIEEGYKESGDLLDAMREAYMKMPGEICGLAVHEDESDRIIAATINQSIVAGLDDSGMYLASIGLALPDAVTWRASLPMNTAAAVTRHGMRLKPFDPSAVPVDMNCPYAEAEAMVLDALKNEPGATFGKAAWGLTKSLWPDGALTRSAPMCYEIIERLHRTGRIRFDTERVPGMFNEGTVPRVRMHLST
ncbi:MAG: hypothetical protein AB1696_21855 [Planctomycetota bacterium]